MAFDPEEADLLRQLESQLRRVEEWPVDSPLGFVVHLAPRTRGRLGELLLDALANGANRHTRSSRTPDFDRLVEGNNSPDVRIEGKFSTEIPSRFQQVRDPRRPGGGLKYDYLVCISGRPDGLVYWVIDANDVGRLMDAGLITIQHAMSNTKWFFPRRDGDDLYAPFQMTYSQVKTWLTNL